MFGKIAVLCADSYIYLNKHSIPHIHKEMPYYGSGLCDRAFVTISQSLYHRLTVPGETVYVWKNMSAQK